MDRYELKENIGYSQTIKDKITIEIPKPRYTVWCTHHDLRKVDLRLFDIPDYFRNSEGIGNGIVKLLNSNIIRLNLEI